MLILQATILEHGHQQSRRHQEQELIPNRNSNSTCTTDATVSVTVSEQSAPEAGTTTHFSICEGTFVTEALLNANITGNDPGGTWTPTITPISGAATYTYTVLATAPCTEPATVTVEVTEQSAPVAGTTTPFQYLRRNFCNGSLTKC